MALAPLRREGGRRRPSLVPLHREGGRWRSGATRDGRGLGRRAGVLAWSRRALVVAGAAGAGELPGRGGGMGDWGGECRSVRVVGEAWEVWKWMRTWARVVKWAANLGHLGFMKLNCNGLGSSVTRVKEPNRTEDFGSWELGTEQRTEILGSGSRLVRFGPRFSVKFAQG